MIPDVAIGAVIAALIGAMISLVGLIVTKEAKVSEFRQAWIDKVRNELALFMTHLNALEDARGIKFETPKEQFQSTKESTAKLNESYFSVALRLNLNETSAQAVHSAMISLARMVNDPHRDTSRYETLKSEFISSSNVLLKHEWVRVRDGEDTYKRTKRTAFWGALISIILIAALISINRIAKSKQALERPSATTTVQYIQGEQFQTPDEKEDGSANEAVPHLPDAAILVNPLANAIADDKEKAAKDAPSQGQDSRDASSASGR